MFTIKRFLLIISVCAFSFLVFSCSTDDENGNQPNNSPQEMEDNRYYVKYEARNAHYYLNDVSVNTESGTQRFEVKSESFSQTFGPVKKGFNASIRVGMSYTPVSIYISKGEEPFVLKKTGEVSASYTIDF